MSFFVSQRQVLEVARTIHNYETPEVLQVLSRAIAFPTSP